MAKLIDNTIRKARASARGVPNYVLYDEFPRNVQALLTRIEVQSENGIKAFNGSKQWDMYETALNSDFKNNAFYIMTADNYDNIIAQMALTLFVAAWEQTTKNPYWHVVDGSTKDRIRDDREWRENNVGRPNFLVISGAAVNSTAMKLEKIRDILTLYSGIPRVLLVSGCDPYKYCTEYLYMRPHRMLYIGNNSNRG